MPAGDYPDRLQWHQRTPDTPDGFGQPTDTFVSQGPLWGVVEDVSSGRASQKESERVQPTAVVRLRNYPAVAALDRLIDGGGAVWTVESVVAGDNETRCDVTQDRWTVGGGDA